jgi:hypothetical protein
VRNPFAGVSRPWQIAVGIYAAWLAFAYAVLLRADGIYLWHFALFALAALLFANPRLLRPRRGPPRRAHFFLVGLVWSALVAMPLATLLRGDLHPNLIVNSALWFGGCGALVGAWMWLVSRWRWPAPPLYFVAGAIALAEPGFVVVRSVQHGAWSGLLVLLPVLHATHACLVAPVANAYRDAFSDATRPATGGAFVTGIVLGTAAFLFGAAAWFAIVKQLLGAPAGT